MKRKQKSHFKRWAVISACGALVVVFTLMFGSQYMRLKSLREQRNKLNQRLEELQIEEQRLELFASYVETKQYADDYLRNELGYILPNEVLLDD